MTTTEPSSQADRVVGRDEGGDRWVTREIAGETLIVPVSNQVGDLDAIYTLNEVGTRIWQLIESPTPVAAIARAISEEFEVGVDQASSDVVEFLALLETKGLLRSERTDQPGN